MRYENQNGIQTLTQSIERIAQVKFRFKLLGRTIFSLVALLAQHAAIALEPCTNDTQPVAQVVSTQGSLEILPGKHRLRQIQVTAGRNDLLCPGDALRSGAISRGAITFLSTDAVLRIDQNSHLRLPEPKKVEYSVIELLRGIIHFFSRKPYQLDVATPFVNGTVEGTEFLVEVQPDQASILVFEGIVRAWNKAGELAVGSNEIVIATVNSAPIKRASVRSQDSVQWTLFYPPIGAAATMSPDIREAARLMDVGRVGEASSLLAKQPDNATALSLRATIAVVQNRNQEAERLAREALSIRPESSIAHTALSYVQQSQFDIQGAAGSAKLAVHYDSENAHAWARLAELQSGMGRLKAAKESAIRATAIDPKISRTQTVLGFSHLTRFETREAINAFEKAITLDQADPLPRLGLGLAKINSGKLAEGRQNLEIAVSLDANSSLLRAYLGKGYFEEKRYPLDSRQYTIAKQLDPNDPTAYLYDGILKQTINRPIEAIENLEKSIELNDNRAVYRSRLLLDEDRAARYTSLARAYNDLRFAQLGINESTKSLTLDPSNAAAHRFLSDTYLGAPRLEISRVSELLQAQLMQDININPIQPSLAETNLNVLARGGPVSSGFNEFTPLFERNQTQFNVSGVGGNNDTSGGEAVLSGVHDRISYSIGGFAYKTDGWRANNDLDQNVYNIFLQGAIDPKVNLQVEALHRDSDEGDVALQFDPRDIVLDKRREIDQDSLRLGLRYSPEPNSPRSTFLLSYINSDTDEKLRESDQIDPFTSFSQNSDRNTKGDMVEGQYIYQRERLNLVAGAAYSNLDTVINEKFQVIDIDFGPVFSEDARIDEKIEHPRAYVYANIHTGEESVDWTLGASYDDFTDEPIEKSSFNPKFGVRWQLHPDVVLRAAGFRVIKPSFVNNRTIEPTQVAGFNQFFDDLPGTESWRYGAAIDWRPGDRVWGGMELTWRDLDEPTKVVSESGAETTQFDDQKEQLHRLYFYWTPTDRLAAKVALVYDRYRGQGPAVQFGPRPEDIKTLSLPLSLRYFNPNGLFAVLGGTYVDQKVRRAESSRFADGNDNFFVVDAAVGYRLPKRRGNISLAVKNLFDEQFMYQDNSFREFSEEAVVSPFVPDRAIIGSVTLSF